MARMIPASIHPSVRSGAERRLFDILQNAPGTTDWVCLHSLGLARHVSKRRGEIDFLLLTRQGIFVLEVKGGRISRSEGVWQFTDRYGETHEKVESPFDQASSAMFALEEDIRNRFPSDRRRSSLLFGYGVMFPDIVFGDVGTEADSQLLYDARDRRQPITHYIDRLAAFARERDPRPRYALTEKDIEALVDFLRGDFDRVPPLSVLADASAVQLLELEKEQYAVLDALEPFPRLVVQGGAGTGKTVLAVETAKREASLAGEDVLFLCYNRFLARFLNERTQEDSRGGRIVVKSIYRLLNELIESSSFDDEFRQKRANSEDDVLYRKHYPEYAALALLEADVQPFKTLIIDEGQDMMNQGVLDVIDSLLEGGLEAGRWRVFCDVNNQAAVFGAVDPKALDRLLRFGHSMVLATNRRNTKPIADETVMLTRPRIAAPASVSGLPVKYSWYEKPDAQTAKLARIVRKLLSDDVAPGRITVLSPRNLQQCCAASVTEPRMIPVCEENIRDITMGRCREVTFGTVSAFKGLENDFIILTDIDDLDTDWWRSVIYVGMSRARVGLHLLLNESLRSVYDERLRSWLEQHGIAAPATG